jgi:hypothetical protein
MGCQAAKKTGRNLDRPPEPTIPKMIIINILIQEKQVHRMELPVLTKVNVIIDEIKTKYKTEELYLKEDNGDIKHLSTIAEQELFKLLPDSTVMNVHIKTTDIEYTQDWRSEYNKIKFCGKFFTNPQHLVIFDKLNQKIYSQTLDSNVAETNQITFIADSSAHCNGRDYLFISGGEGIKHLWQIDLSGIEVKFFTDILPKERYLHSMIYIPKKYIFIIGGYENKNVDYFDIDTGMLATHSQISETKIDPTLAFVDEGTLWAFTNDITQFERNRIYTSTVWEKVNIRTEVNFTKKFFAASHHAKNQLIFLGGYSESDDNYLFNFSTETLEKTDIKTKNAHFSSEKFFLPSGSINLLFGQMTAEELKILSYSEGELKEHHYEIDPEHAILERVIKSLFKNS